MVISPTAVLWGLVGIAAAWDVAQRRIPNALILTGLLLALALQTQAGGLAGLGLAILGAAVALGVLIGPFALHLMGGGDVKLGMVVGAFLGWSQGLEVILVGTVLHGLIAAGFLVALQIASSQGRATRDLDRVPFAVGLASSTVLLTSGLIDLW